MLTGPEDKAPLVEHLVELRQRLIIAIGAIFGIFCLILLGGFDEAIFAFLVQPLRKVAGPDVKMVYLGLHHAFYIYMKVSLFAAFFLASPIILIQIWRFVAPGLYQHERNTVLPFLIATPVLFFLGGALAYFFVLPLAFQFFLSYTSPSIESLPAMPDYLSLVMTFLFAFGLSFELPVFLLLLISAGFLSTEKLVQVRRYQIVMVFIVAGILTPPDPFSQILLAVPLLLLYEVSIFTGRILEKRRKEREEQAEHEEHQAEVMAAAHKPDSMVGKEE